MSLIAPPLINDYREAGEMCPPPGGPVVVDSITFDKPIVCSTTSSDGRLVAAATEEMIAVYVVVDERKSFVDSLPGQYECRPSKLRHVGSFYLEQGGASPHRLTLTPRNCSLYVRRVDGALERICISTVSQGLLSKARCCGDDIAFLELESSQVA